MSKYRGPSASPVFLIALLAVAGLVASSCGVEAPPSNALVRETHGRRGNQSSLAEWHTARELLANETWWEANAYWVSEIPTTDPETGEVRLRGSELQIPDRADRAGMVRFDNWYQEHFAEIPQNSMLSQIGFRVFQGVQTEILAQCQGTQEPATRDCPTIEELVAEIDFKIDKTGAIEWAAMSEVVQQASLEPLGSQTQFLPNYFESIEPFDDQGVQRIATDIQMARTHSDRTSVGNLLIPDYDDTEAVEAFAAWFDETFTTDPDSPYFVYVEKPAEAYRQLLYESLEFCEAEPDLCGNTLEELDRTE